MTNRMKVMINQRDRQIEFLGLVFSERGHVKWLRQQLALIEANGEFLWPEDKGKPDNIVHLSLVSELLCGKDLKEDK